MSTFKAFRITTGECGVNAALTDLSLDQLTAGDVVIDVVWSSINYKDALAATGEGRILRAPALNGGIDVAGVVRSSDDARFQPGDEVFACGAGLSEFVDGGYSQVARLPGSTLRVLPEGLTMKDTMALGTAGLTACIALERMEANGQIVDLGPIVVTGATGGVGSVAINLLQHRGYTVVASTGKSEAHYLQRIGATQIMGRFEPGVETPKPLESAQWGGAVDSVGGETLAWLARTVKPWGNIACVGLAGGAALHTTVMPLILRGVSLLGINCIELPESLLERCWQRLATDLKPPHLDVIADQCVTLAELPDAFDAYMKGTVRGRTLVKVA